MTNKSPRLDLAALLATKVFDEDDLAHNRRGVLSQAQEAWRKAHPAFMDEDDRDDGAVETLVGRVVIEGRYVADSMATSFAELVLSGRRFSLRPGLKKALVRDAPFRAYAALGWIWSIEPITEDELRATTSAVTYRTLADPDDEAPIARELQAALAMQLSFDEEDVAANRSGHFSPKQRSTGRKKIVFAIARVLIAICVLWGFAVVLNSAEVIPVFAAFLGLAGLLLALLTSARSLLDALDRLVYPGPLSLVAWLDDDPTNRDNLVLRSEQPPLKIKRAAVAIAAAPLSALRDWRFEVFFLPSTRRVLAVRPVPPSERERDEEGEIGVRGKRGRDVTRIRSDPPPLGDGTFR